MGDVVMVLVLLGFFALCVAYVGWCGRIIGPDPDDPDDPDDLDESGEPTAVADAKAL
jgi:hypothetical protein